MGFTIYELKPRFQALLRPTARSLQRAGVTANMVTIVAALGSVALGGALLWTFATDEGAASRRLLLAILPAFLFVRMALNAIDGMLAREFNQKSALGAFLNELGDVVSDVALYLPIALAGAFAPLAIVAIVAFGALAEFAGVISQTLGASRRYDGPFGKSDRAFVFGLWGLLAATGVYEGRVPLLVSWAFAVLAAYTLVKRVRNSLLEIRMKGRRP